MATRTEMRRGDALQEDGSEFTARGGAFAAAKARGGVSSGTGEVVGRKEATPGPGDALPREVTEFLVSFAMALHRFAMYPPGHPSLEPSAERMLTQLGGVLGARSTLTVGVTTRQLLVGGALSPEGHHVLSDLAKRLHGHELGAIVIRAGLEMDEITDALRMLARDPVRGERPLGRLPARDRPAWKHLQVLPVEYDALELTEGERSEGEALSVRELWLALFRSAFRDLEALREVEALHAGGSLPTGLELAGVLREHPAGPGDEGSGPEAEIVAALHRLVAGLQWQGDGEGQDLRLRASELLRELDLEVMTRLLRLGSDPEGRRRLLLRTARAGLASDAVLRVLDAALAAEGREMSRPLLRLLAKLGAGTEAAPGAARSEARSTLREQVEGIAAGWHEVGRFGRGGDPVWGRDPGADNGEELPRPTPIRVVELAVATDASGPALDAALEACVRRGNVERVLVITEHAPHDSRAATHIENYLLSPTQLRALLSGDDVDEGSLRRIVDVLGEAAIGPLFDALATSDSRSVRRKIFDRLVAMGPRITPIVMTFLSSDAWFVRRNMLALLQRMPVLPPVSHRSPTCWIPMSGCAARRFRWPSGIRGAGSTPSRSPSKTKTTGTRDSRCWSSRRVCPNRSFRY
jgi:hypothetical protein